MKKLLNEDCTSIENSDIAVFRHLIRENNVNYNDCKNICHLSKNVYNATLYLYLQFFNKIEGFEKQLSEFDIKNKFTKEKNIDYYALPTKVSKMTIKRCCKAIKSYKNGLYDYFEDLKNGGKKYKAEPKPPKYIKKEGHAVTEYYKEALLFKNYNNGVIGLSGTTITISLKMIEVDGVKRPEIDKKDIIGARIVPRNGHFFIELIYNRKNNPKIQKNTPVVFAGIDVGVNNLAAISVYDDVKKKSNNLLVNGRGLKSINQYYNKKKKKIKKILWKTNKKKTSKQLDILELKRYNKITDYLHKSTRRITDYLVSEGVDVLFIGHNNGWKQDVNMGSVNNQNFGQIPFNRFITMMNYKCGYEGIKVIQITEEYTSKSSFIHDEPFKKYNFIGNRAPRGLFTANGIIINSDINASLNMIRKGCKVFKGVTENQRKQLCSDPIKMDVEKAQKKKQSSVE